MTWWPTVESIISILIICHIFFFGKCDVHRPIPDYFQFLLTISGNLFFIFVYFIKDPRSPLKTVRFTFEGSPKNPKMWVTKSYFSYFSQFSSRVWEVWRRFFRGNTTLSMRSKARVNYANWTRTFPCEVKNRLFWVWGCWGPPNGEHHCDVQKRCL